MTQGSCTRDRAAGANVVRNRATVAGVEQDTAAALASVIQAMDVTAPWGLQGWDTCVWQILQVMDQF